MNNTKNMNDLKTEFIRPFTEEEIDKLNKRQY